MPKPREFTRDADRTAELGLEKRFDVGIRGVR